MLASFTSKPEFLKLQIAVLKVYPYFYQFIYLFILPFDFL
jgi:hypothetical protein